jgi:transcription initiation factor TFIID TATA-box-binding protein
MSSDFSFSSSLSSPLIENILCTFWLGIKHLDLRLLSRFLWNSVYDPAHSLNCCQIKVREPKCTANVYSSGKVVCLETKSQFDSILAARKIARSIQKALQRIELLHSSVDSPSLSVHLRILNFVVHNITGSCQLPFNLDLRSLVAESKFSQFIQYEPESFASCAYFRLPSELLDEQSAIQFWAREEREETPDKGSKLRSVTWSLFPSGHCKFSGAQRLVEIELGFALLCNVLEPFASLSSKREVENSRDDKEKIKKQSSNREKRRIWEVQDSARKKIKQENQQNNTAENSNESQVENESNQENEIRKDIEEVEWE